jgi:5-methylcytosine-specific restriction endonuclease McrA
MPIVIYKHKPNQGFQRGNHPKTEFQKGNKWEFKKGNKIHLGKKHSKKTKKRLSELHKGKIPYKMTDRVRRNMSKAKIGKCYGKLNNNWKGGITPLLLRIRFSFKYRQWRSDVFTRDNFTCQECGDNKGGNLEAHHIKEFAKIIEEYQIKTLEQALSCEELWNINNGRTLCLKCHNKINKKLRC